MKSRPPRDAQRIAGHYYKKYVEYATIALGLYAAAYGSPEDKILEIQNLKIGKTLQDREYGKIYKNLPEDNVKWTNIGYELYNSKKISPESKNNE